MLTRIPSTHGLTLKLKPSWDETPSQSQRSRGINLTELINSFTLEERTQWTPPFGGLLLWKHSSISFFFWKNCELAQHVPTANADEVWRFPSFLSLLLSSVPGSATLPRDPLFNLEIRCHDVSACWINDCLGQVPSLQSVLLITAQMLSSWLSAARLRRPPVYIIYIFLFVVNYCWIAAAWQIEARKKEGVWQKSLLHK